MIVALRSVVLCAVVALLTGSAAWAATQDSEYVSPVTEQAKTKTKTGDEKGEYRCPPCRCENDEKRFSKPGVCSNCGMKLVKEKTSDADGRGDSHFARQQWAEAVESYKQAVVAEPGDGNAWTRLGYSLHMLGRLDEALVAHKRAAEFAVGRPIALFNVACVFSLKGEKDAAFAALGQAIESGFSSADSIDNDKDLENLRSDPRFAEVRTRFAAAQAEASASRKNVAIFIHDRVELLDFAGPGEVFSSVRTSKGLAFNVYTVAVSTEPIVSQRFLTVIPQYTFENCPKPDIVVLPGGATRVALQNEATMSWIKRVASDADIMLSVCTGALLLAQNGLLDGLEATTHHGTISRLRQVATKTRVYDDRRFVDNGKIITAAGVSAGIDASLHVVERLLGRETAKATAYYMEYDWRPERFASTENLAAEN